VPDREHVNFPILSDMDDSYAMSLNLAIWVGAELREYMTGIGRMLPQCRGNDSPMLSIPATFVVGQGWLDQVTLRLTIVNAWPT
jgi:hypothetical protein